MFVINDDQYTRCQFIALDIKLSDDKNPRREKNYVGQLPRRVGNASKVSRVAKVSLTIDHPRQSQC